jgi:hypothetical protein
MLAAGQEWCFEIILSRLVPCSPVEMTQQMLFKYKFLRDWLGPLQMTYASLQQLPASAMAATLGVNTTGYETLLSASPKGVFIKSSDPDCVARCQLAPAKSGATVSAASVSG